MTRAFVAIPVSLGFAESLAPYLKKLRVSANKRSYDLKWTPQINYHITLQFLGDTEDAQLEDYKVQLARLSQTQDAFDLKIEDISAFPEEREARVIWLGVQNKIALRDLRDKVLSLLSIQSDEVFVPHLTICRSRNFRNVVDLISPLKRKSFGKLRVDQISLFKSELRGHYPVYSPIFTQPFGGAYEG